MSGISVALCTFNGAQYLSEQLVSISTQSRLPDELVIGDDCSEDDTTRIIEKFAAIVPFSVQIIRNEIRLGVRRNFEKVIASCSNELIALCDQDDIWLPSKLAVLESRFEGKPEVVAAFSDAIVVDDSLRELGYTMWEHVEFNVRRRQQLAGEHPWEGLSKGPVVTGATLMFRKSLVRSILPIPASWIHDAWIAQIAASRGTIGMVEEPLILYRQHSANLIGGKRLTLRQQWLQAVQIGRLGLVERELSKCRALLERLARLEPSPTQVSMWNMNTLKLEHLSRRQGLAKSRLGRVPVIFRECLNGNYRRFAKDWRNVAADLLMS